MQDVTDNIMEEADARPVLMNGGNEVTVPPEDNLPFLHVGVSLHSLSDRVVQEVRRLILGPYTHPNVFAFALLIGIAG